MQFRTVGTLSLTLSLAALSLVACAPALVSSPAPVTSAVEQAQPSNALPVGTFSGKVASYDVATARFVPVAGASIQVEGTPFTATTDADGVYTVGGVKPGSYTVKATKAGMQDSSTHLILNPVAGTPRVNVAMAPVSRSVLATAITVTVSGVVSDPRGAALPGANGKAFVHVQDNASAAGLGSNDPAVPVTADGFFVKILNAVGVNGLSKGQVQVTAHGTSPGGVALETTVGSYQFMTNTQVVASVQCDAFVRPDTPIWPNGNFSPPGSAATIASDYMSLRADEFYVQINDGTGNWVTGDGLYDVLATGVAAQTAPRTNATFRIPVTVNLPTQAGKTFTARIVPFGLTARATAPTPISYITRYLQSDLDADLTFANTSLTDTDNPAGAITGVNALPAANLLVGKDKLRWTIDLVDSSTVVGPEIQLEAITQLGAKIVAASYKRKVDGTLDASATTIPAANIVDVDGTGKFTLKGLPVPAKSSGSNGELRLTVDLEMPTNLPNLVNVNVTNPAFKMISNGQVLLTYAGPNPPAATTALTASGIDTAAFQIVKTISDDPGAVLGKGMVTLTLKPGANTKALGSFKITDTTKTNAISSAAKATITGTKAMPASPTACGLTKDNVLVLSIDGGTSVAVQVFDNAVTFDQFAGQISTTSGLAGLITVSREAGTNKMVIQRTVAGSNRNIAIKSTSDAALLTALGLTATVTPVAGQDGLLPDFTGATAVMAANGTAWAIVPDLNLTKQNNDGSVTAVFTLTPPAAFVSGDTYSNDITVKYFVLGPTASAITLGGVSAPAVGAKIFGYNLSAPFTDVTRDQTMPAGVFGQDPATTVTGL